MLSQIQRAAVGYRNKIRKQHTCLEHVINQILVREDNFASSGYLDYYDDLEDKPDRDIIDNVILGLKKLSNVAYEVWDSMGFEKSYENEGLSFYNVYFGTDGLGLTTFNLINNMSKVLWKYWVFISKIVIYSNLYPASFPVEGKDPLGVNYNYTLKIKLRKANNDVIYDIGNLSLNLSGGRYSASEVSGDIANYSLNRLDDRFLMENNGNKMATIEFGEINFSEELRLSIEVTVGSSNNWTHTSYYLPNANIAFELYITESFKTFTDENFNKRLLHENIRLRNF